jgi:alpha-D-xyloside xylohydrolase
MRAASEATPYESLPVYVRAGSVIPIGPELEHTGEKPADPLTLWVYPGADGAFELYDDDGVTYDYQRGAFATIPLHWDEARGTLTIGARSGSFPGMLARRELRVVFVSRGAAIGDRPEPQPARVVTYQGRPVVVRARAQVTHRSSTAATSSSLRT